MSMETSLILAVVLMAAPAGTGTEKPPARLFESAADLTPRRRQAFLPNAGSELFYAVSDALDVVVTDGAVIVDANRLLTLEQVSLDSNWKTIRFYRATETPLCLLTSLPQGTSVITPKLVVTCKLPDRFYAEKPDRSGAVEVLGTMSVSVAQIVRIYGTTVQGKTIQALDVLSYGTGSPIPPVTPRIRDLAGDQILQDCFVTVWGRVQSKTENDFTISDGSGGCRIEGLGTQAVGNFLFVRGIRLEPDGPQRLRGLEAQQLSP